MNKSKFQDGDWIFCEYKLQQVKTTEEDRITSVTDGRFSLSSYDLTDRCFPLDLRIKNASDTIAYWSSEFHKLKNNSLNHPDLNRELIRRWIEMCEAITDDKLLQEKYNSLDKFGRAVLNEVNNIRYKEIEGVNIFR